MQGQAQRAVHSTKVETDLTARVRALYEGSAVPVCEIAAMAGVTERTIYKYARMLRWKPRYAWMPDGARPPGGAGRKRYPAARQLMHAEQFAPVKGAGGRFIRRADKDKPVATGLKATDRAAAARAAAACAEAERLARAAQTEAEDERRQNDRLRAFDAVNRAMDKLTEYRAERAKQEKERMRIPGTFGVGGMPGPAAPPRPKLRLENDPVEQSLVMTLRAALDWLEAAQAETMQASDSPLP